MTQLKDYRFNTYVAETVENEQNGTDFRLGENDRIVSGNTPIIEKTDDEWTFAGKVAGLVAESIPLTDDQDSPTIGEALSEFDDTITAHTENKNNPHGVTKAQVGLGNVDNTSDLDKPISTATQAAITLNKNYSWTVDYDIPALAELTPWPDVFIKLNLGTLSDFWTPVVPTPVGDSKGDADALVLQWSDSEADTPITAERETNTSEWIINGNIDGIRWLDDYWYGVDKEYSPGWVPYRNNSIGNSKGDVDSMELSWIGGEDAMIDIAATRELLPGYRLGNQDPVLAEAKDVPAKGQIANNNTGYVTGGDAFTALSGKANLVVDNEGNKTAFTIGTRGSGTIGKYSVSTGDKNIASGFAAHAEANVTTASGAYSHAEGDNTQALGFGAHADGNRTIAAGDHSHTSGLKAVSRHSTGIDTYADDKYAWVWQGSIEANSRENYYSHGAGTFNINPIPTENGAPASDPDADVATGFFIGEISLADRLTGVVSGIKERTIANGGTQTLFDKAVGGTATAEEVRTMVVALYKAIGFESAE